MLHFNEATLNSRVSNFKTLKIFSRNLRTNNNWFREHLIPQRHYFSLPNWMAAWKVVFWNFLKWLHLKIGVCPFFRHPICAIFHLLNRGITTARKVSVLWVFLVRIFLQSDWINNNNPILRISTLSSNARKYGPKKLRIPTLFSKGILFFLFIIYSKLTNLHNLFINYTTEIAK